jgi:glycine amidinotransferase
MFEFKSRFLFPNRDPDNLETTLPAIHRRQVISSHTEWDTLEEVIVGTLEGATVPQLHSSMLPTLPKNGQAFFGKNGGTPFSPEKIKAGQRDLDELSDILRGEGIIVKRPEAASGLASFSTPNWSCPTGIYAAMPRDVLLAIGNELIEVPMAWRSRYFEVFPYRKLLKDYFKQGARWSSAPKPELKDELFVENYQESKHSCFESVITEAEPVFDAADFLKFGRDLVGQLSHVTNRSGVEWLQRHLGDQYTVRILEFDDPHPMHIDATIMPLAPGKLLINPERVTKVPAIFKDWDLLPVPQPMIPDSHPLYMTSKWITMNVLSLDEKRVIVERNEKPLIRALKDWGFEPILCNFRNFNSFGGSFHCATLDVRRSGELRSYL